MFVDNCKYHIYDNDYIISNIRLYIESNMDQTLFI
jgi:hypothetical protein